jgi:hypothetical protein
MEDLHSARPFKDPVVYVERRVLKASDIRIATHGRAQKRKVAQQVKMIEEGVGEALGRCRIILP